jgi:benzoylsuccinyl-CoA thiolase BbsB subunit
MRDVFIIGTGMVPFGRYPELLLEDFTKDAVTEAVDDAGLGAERFDVAVFSHSNGGRVAGQRVLRELSLTGMPILNVENACAGGGTSLHVGWLAVASGLHDIALVVGMEKMERGLIPPNPGEYESFLGKTLPAKYALRARKHMQHYGLTVEQLAQVSVKNHFAGALNPNAHYQQEVTLEEVLASRPIAEPLTLLQCCPTTDGAAALVIASAEVAERLGRRGVRIAASILKSGIYRNSSTDATASDDDLAERAGGAAYEMAGLGPSDIDVAEVHDAFTIGEILAYENLGFCERGGGGRLVDEGVTALGGRLPVNTSGGRLSMGHPLGATGVAQVVELTRQLEGRCGARQVPRARTALAHVQGGSTPGIGTGAATVHILTTEETTELP